MNGEPSAAPRPDRHEESPESREAALRRVVVWYLHSADAAQTWINSQEAHIPLDPPGDDLTPASFADYEEAMRWYEAERGNLLAATRAAEEAGLDVIAWQLPAVLRSVHMLLNPFEEWLAMSRIGLRAARRLGDRAAEAELLESLVIHLRGRRLEAAKSRSNGPPRSSAASATRRGRRGRGTAPGRRTGDSGVPGRRPTSTAAPRRSTGSWTTCGTRPSPSTVSPVRCARRMRGTGRARPRRHGDTGPRP
ncbi:hypothetical protein ACFV42_37640 [Streptomyces solisilvae]|uniref:hypothetical protein n=1 Tax=Streptomyces malaysiensis TaxID=92644 RepID=UPI003686276F